MAELTAAAAETALIDACASIGGLVQMLNHAVLFLLVPLELARAAKAEAEEVAAVAHRALAEAPTASSESSAQR